MTPARTTFIWGLKRSGIHLVVNWLYANCGGAVKSPLITETHPQLRDGFEDEVAGVAFYNNCGGLHSRQFEVGELFPEDFDGAASRHAITIFGIEDCGLRFASRTPDRADSANVLVLRDPLNNLASRLEARRNRPDVFPADEAFIDLFDAYCAEYLGHSSNLPGKTLVSYNRFVDERAYRDSVAAGLGIHNLDEVSEVSAYGGGSSFSEGDVSSAESLMSRYRQHPIPRHLLDLLLERSAVREACSTVFGYDLAERVADL